jgi:hypothetical protein
MNGLRRFAGFIVGNAIVLFARFLTAVRGIWLGIEPVPHKRVYYSNHTSVDFAFTLADLLGGVHNKWAFGRLSMRGFLQICIGCLWQNGARNAFGCFPHHLNLTLKIIWQKATIQSPDDRTCVVRR